VNKNSRKRKETTVATFSVSDDQSEHYKDVYAAIAKSRQIATFRRLNSTIVGYTVAEKKASLEESIGCSPLHPLGSVRGQSSPHHYVLLTGVAGDCRAAVRFLKQTALNHTFEFGSEPSGTYLADRLGKYLISSQGDRSLAVHAFVVSTSGGIVRHGGERRPGSIYEVGAAGSVTCVRGGTIGGSHAPQARRRLEEHYRIDLSEVGSRALVSEVFDLQLNGVEVDTEGGSDGTPKPLFEYIEIHDK